MFTLKNTEFTIKKLLTIKNVISYIITSKPINNKHFINSNICTEKYDLTSKDVISNITYNTNTQHNQSRTTHQIGNGTAKN